MKINPLQMEILAGEEEYNSGKEIEETGGVRGAGLCGGRLLCDNL